MSNRRLLLVCASVVLAAAWVVLARGAPTVTTGSVHGAAASGPSTLSGDAHPDTPRPSGRGPAVPAAADPELPPEFFAELAPGESIAMTIPAGLTSGIRCPDGSYLPLLNGVDRAGPLDRVRTAGPLPPVVAKQKEADGLEWYVHADGSKTTTHRVVLEVEGRPMENVATRHVSALPGEHRFPVDSRNARDSEARLRR